MEPLRSPQIEVETIWRTILVTDARDSSKAYFSARAGEALVRIERDRALFAQIAAGHGGEEARDRGDGSMFAFCDPVEALRAAMAMQAEIARLNAELPEEALRLVHRMGMQMGPINLATTRVAGAEAVRRKLSGDIVVTAARLEALCHPGEVCFSNDVYRVVRRAFQHEFRHLDATLKGFDRPVRCWSTRFDREWARPLTSEEEAARQRKVEEKRLREKWEREQRERHLRHVALRCAAWFAAASVLFAGFRIVQTATGFDTRVSRAWDGLLRSPEAAPAWEVPPPGPVLVAKEPSAAVAEPSERVASVIRVALVTGRFDSVSDLLAGLGLPVAEYEGLRDDARRVVRARTWLAGRLAQSLKGYSLRRPVEGMTVLMRADARRVEGLDPNGTGVTIPYSRLRPWDLFVLLKAASGSEAAPDAPEACARSLASLRRRAGWNWHDGRG